MAFQRNVNWNTGDPITQERMNNIQRGIEEALDAAETADQHGTIASMQTTIGNIQNIVGDSESSGLRRRVTSLETTLESATSLGNWAAGQIHAATDQRNSDIQFENLDTRLVAMTNETARVAGIVNAHSDNLNSAIRSTVLNDTLGKRFADVERDALALSTGYQALRDDLNAAGEGYTDVNNQPSLVVRLNNYGGRISDIESEIDTANGNGTLNDRFNAIEDELNAAHVSTALNSNGNDRVFSTIDDRFEAIESELVGASDMSSRLDTLDSNVSNLTTNKVNKTDIENNLTTQDEVDRHVLDARQGRVLKETIDALDTAYKAADTAIGGRIDAVDTAIGATENDGLRGRIKALEDEVDAANGNGTLDDRFDAVEDRATQLETDVSTIANELNMVNTQTGAIQDTNSRIDTIEANVIEIGKEIGMLQEADTLQTWNEALTRSNTKIDSIQDELDDARIQIGTDDNTGDPILSTLDERLDSIDTAIGNNTTAIGVNAAAISHAAEGNDPGGLTERLTVAESDIEDINTAISHVKDENDANDKGGLTQRMDAAETAIGTKAAASDLTTLAGRVTTLENEPKSATVIIDIVTYDQETGKPTSIQTPSTDVDYLLKKDNKYYYWKYIKTGSNPDTYSWELISGGGGNGNTSGVNLSRADYTALAKKEENTDYYVTDTDGVHHYRWIPGENNTLTEIEIGRLIDTSQIKKYNIYTVAGTKQLDGGGTEDVVYLNLYQYDYDEDNSTIDTQRPYFARVELPKGGGGAASNTVNNLIRIGNQTTETIVGSNVKLRVFYSSWDGPQSNDGTFVLKAGSTTIDSGTLHSGAKDEEITGWKANTDGYYEFDVSKYCKVGTTGFTLTVTVNGTPLGKSWTVDMKDLRIETTAPETLLIGSTESYQFNYTPFGALTKLLHVLIDDHEVGTYQLLSNTSGRENSFTITPKMITDAGLQIHGAHTIEMYLTATIGGVLRQTDSIIRQYIWYDASNTTTPIILASPYSYASIDILDDWDEWTADTTYHAGDRVKITNGTSVIGYICKTENSDSVFTAEKWNAQIIDASQYSTIKIPYQIYKKDATTIDVYYYLNDSETPYDHVVLEDTNVGTLSYLALDTGAQTITIQVDDQSMTFNLSVSAIEGVNISPVSGALIDFDPATLTNSSANRLPTWTTNKGTFNMTASDNFNWSDDVNGGGYKEDEDGKCFVIKAGSYVDIDYKMFERREENGVMTNVLDRGAEIKVIFKTKAVRNADAIWFTDTGSYNDKTVGIQLGAHVGWLKTDKAAEEDTEDTTEEYPAWVASTAYVLDDVVVYKNIIYKCIKVCVDETTIIPGSGAATNHWTQLTGSAIPEDTSEIPAWASGTEYAKDDIVSYDEAYYKAKKDIINEPAVVPKDLSDNWLKMGATESEVLATNSYLYLPYSERDKIELDININKYSAGSTNNFIMSYEDGVPSKAYAYSYGVSGDGLVHNSGIRIGSADCDVYLYHLRIYNNALTTDKILQNFIADGKNIDEKVRRYNKNCIYWDPTQGESGAYFTSPSGTATLDPVKLAERMPNVKVLMLDTPVFTVGKKNFVQNSTLRCIHAKAPANYDGDILYESRGDADNWFFQGGFHAGQGTTSDNYGQSSRNVDFLFEVDGVHYPTKSKNMKNYTPSMAYRSSVLVGEDASKWDEESQTWVPTSVYDEINQEWVPNEDILSAEEIQKWTAHAPDYCEDWKGDHCKIALTSSSIPNNYFNLKVNVASSENVNNALFQERFNEFLSSVYQSPAYKRDHKIKNDMEFVPAVLFVRENDTTRDAKGNYTKHTEFNDTNWHFYALGNIGDSKKTDYTRAYNPYDMNEFTVENSDNNTNNGQFQSGVFMYQDNIRAVETDYAEWSNTKAYANKDIVTKEGKIYRRSGADQAALEGNATYNWVAADWTDITPTTTKTIYYAPRTNPNPMDYLYGIDPEEWNVKMTVADSAGTYHYVNRKHDMLVTEKFDGDHSFEFRYACMGDYRDGDLINDTTGLAKSQEKTNQNIVFNFYDWLVTATDQEYEDEASNWFVPEAMEFFYAFTHYYTMMDNRAKNTFWHWGKQYITTNDANGVTYTAAASAAETAQAAYDEAVSNLEDVESEQNPIIAQAEADIASADATLQNDPEDAEALAAKEEATSAKEAAEALIAAATATKNAAKSQLTVRILKRDELKFLYDHADCFIVDNAEAAINDGRRFDLWAYDMDTAAGIDNNGALVFPYGKEDEDYRVKGEASSGYAFNGAGSIFWRRLKTTFADDIVTIMNNVDSSCFNSEDLIDQFDQFQDCFPEEIWRLDIERKYIRTFTGASVDNSVTTGKQNPRFLTSMMQGRKKYQRRQWIRDQGVYFNSKYRLTDIIRNENTIEFNIITPTNSSSLALQPSYNLQLTPYQDMYLNVTIGNGGPTPQIRAEAGKTYTLDLLPYSSGTFAETRLYIYGFNHISGIGNLAPMYPYSFTLSALEHLKVLDLGTDVQGYSNANFTVLPFSETTQLPLLETLNIKNCNYLAGGISLDTANNLRVVEAEGTAITGVSLPDYTNIEVLHLPSSVTALELHGARFLKDFQMINSSGQIDYSGLYTLHVYDSDYSENYIWQDETQYKVGDIVMIDNGLYKCILDHTSLTGVEKGDDIIWGEYLTTNWVLIRSNIDLPVDWIKIALEMMEKESPETSLSLQKLSSAKINNIETLMPFDTLKAVVEAVGGLITLSGIITVEGTWSKVETKVYTNNVGYYTGEGDNKVWNAVIPVLEQNESPLFPDLKLIINPSNEQVKHKVTYRYNNKTTVLYISNGTAAPDIYYDGTLADMPTKASTPEYNYIFGSRDADFGTYVQYSGWKLTNSSVPLSGAPVIYTETTLDAYFTGSKRQYFIRWYSQPGNLVASSQRAIEYGGGQNIESPTVPEIHAAGFETCSVSVNNGMVNYSIFTGWDKLPTNIQPDGLTNYYDIYGVWDSGNISVGDLFTDVTNLTPLQLLALSQLTDTDKETYNINNRIDLSTCMTYKLGQDSIATGNVIVSDNSAPLYLNGVTSGTITSFSTVYQPLLAGSDAFTFAIDYTFNDATYTAGKSYAILASCYYSNNGIRNGFGVFKNLSTGNIEVGWGDMYRYSDQRVAISNNNNANMRNILVLRHPKNSPTLYIYSGLGSEQSIPTDTSYATYITRRGESEFNSESYLCIGQIIPDTESIQSDDSIRNSWTRAIGTVYWAKYWNQDLGLGECKRIASWPHEYVTFGIAYSYKDPEAIPTPRAQEGSIPLPSLYLVTRNTLMHGLLVQERVSGSSFVDNLYSWQYSIARRLCNNRLVFSLPTSLQAILCKAEVSQYPILYDEGNGQTGASYEKPNFLSITRDYVFAYSVANLLPNNSAYENEDLLMSPFAWRIPGNVQVYTYDDVNDVWSSTTYNPMNDDGRGQYYNIRFPAKAIPSSGLRIFRSDSNFGSTNIANSIGNNIIRSGDIYIEGALAYIYVSNKEINDYGLNAYIVKDYARFTGIPDNEATNIGGGAGRGGWIRAEDYWTRSLIVGSTQYTIFSEVQQDGNVNLNTISNNTRGNKISYILAI